MTASTDLWEAQMDREWERIMKMSVEEMAAEEGKTVAEILEEGRQTKERVLQHIRSRFPNFGK